MRLTAFRIKNFRSIVDSGWQSVSPDNITCLIGQNESGKTSVLEGLSVFHTGEITEDVLRSDLTLPEVSCRFSVEKGWMAGEAPDSGSELHELLLGIDMLELTRFWLADFTSYLRVSGPVSEYLDSLESAWKLYLEQVAENILREDAVAAGREEMLQAALAEAALCESSMREMEREGTTRTLLKLRGTLSEDARSSIIRMREELTAINRRIEGIRKEIRASGDLLQAMSAWKRYSDDLAGVDERLAEISLRLEKRHQMMTLLMKPDDYDESEWDEVIADYRMLRTDRDELVGLLDDQTALCGVLMEGATPEEASARALEIAHRYKSQYTCELLGERFFMHTPSFVMFEDFGSLLPNRIDLEDIVHGNGGVEGYKAAWNFLTLARLDYSFFLQPSNRILKQTIENLNQQLTSNFHDFWQQSVGGRNKIKIQFELEHYSASHGDKAGKPYIEFWIKDEGERLYPKQRSRGVRWFLSFYLELKASAEKDDRPTVLLVDEPGVSLHARAQEDVLKVFEDISSRIQVVYTTHSPHLVDVNKLHRVLAVQRDDMESYKSSTRIIDPVLLAAASPDTLSPIHSVMGNPFATGFANKKLNLIVSNTGTYYFLSAILKLMAFRGAVNIVPSTEATAIPLLCNIMVGWGLDFCVLIFGGESEQAVADSLETTLFRENGRVTLRMSVEYGNVEDLFSTLDFKKHILKQREGITLSNSVYIKENEMPRDFLASRFLAEVNSGKVLSGAFDEETLENFRDLGKLLSEAK